MIRLLCLLLAATSALICAAATAAEGEVTMSTADQARMGVVVSRVAVVERADRQAGYGRVLDAAPLVALDAELAALDATAGASMADAARSESLFRAGENASRRQWESAQANARADAARLYAARQRVALEWGESIAALNAAQRTNLIARLVQGGASLLRASAPGFAPESLESVSATLHRAAGDPKPLRVLGRAATADPLVAGTAFLLLAEDLGLQTGAPVAVDFSSGRVRGSAVPANALLADGRGMSVYLRRGAEHFERAQVRVLLDQGSTVLVEGLADNAEIVTTNAAVLRWSQTAGSQAPAEADDDDD